MPATLEYEEEDLFDSAEEDIPLQQINTARPIAGPSYIRQPLPINDDRPSSPPIRVRPPPAPCPPERLPLLKSSVGLNRVRPRLLELKEMRDVKVPRVPKVGPVSLKQQCMAVIKANGNRIWDVGDTPYGQVKDFIDELPAEQLAAIEEASPHLRKETDWLWEYFLLTDFAAAHEKFAEKHGERRTSGWRRAYKKAAIEARERQANAAERVAERYKEMDKERADKRIVVLNQVVQPKKPKRVAGGMFGAPKPMTVTAKATGPLGKARADAQRARIAMTHASGKFVPLPSRYPHAGPSTTTISSLNTSRPAAPRPVAGPRIPAPRARPTAPLRSSSPEIIPGALPTSEYLASRANLPSHLVSLSSTSSAPIEPARFSVERKRKFSTIRQANVPSFKPPESKATAGRADFFGGVSAPSTGVKRPIGAEQGDSSSPAKLGRSVEGGSTPRASPSGPGPGSGQAGLSLSLPNGRSGDMGRGPSSSAGISIEEAAKLRGVLFRSKPKPRATGR